MPPDHRWAATPSSTASGTTSVPTPGLPSATDTTHGVLTTTAGDLELRIPKLRVESFFPSLLERRRRVDQALFAVVMEA
jgi:putative transposase